MIRNSKSSTVCMHQDARQTSPQEPNALVASGIQRQQDLAKLPLCNQKLQQTSHKQRQLDEAHVKYLVCVLYLDTGLIQLALLGDLVAAASGCTGHKVSRLYLICVLYFDLGLMLLAEIPVVPDDYLNHAAMCCGPMSAETKSHLSSSVVQNAATCFVGCTLPQ